MVNIGFAGDVVFACFRGGIAGMKDMMCDGRQIEMVMMRGI